MRLINLELRNFRNLTDTVLEFSPGLNLIKGRNSQGKTNLLEALYLFSLGRSFRASSRSEMIKFGKEHAFVRIRAESDSGIGSSVEAGMGRDGEVRIRIDGERVDGFSGIIGRFPAVLFTADDIGLVAGPPGGRRSFLDYTASQISGAYLQGLRDYYRVLKQRNAELKEVSSPEGNSLIRTLAEVLSRKGEKVVEGRREVLEDLDERGSRILGNILGEGVGLKMSYRGTARSEGGYAGNLYRQLEERRAEEVGKGYTVCGPHRDDIRITMEGLDMRKFGSQGRKRLVAIVMKIAQAEVINNRKGEKPVVLLDDIFSELDGEVERKMGGFISKKYQNFITSPREVDIESENKVRKFLVKGGEISVE